MTVVYHNVSWISIIETANRTVHEPSINLICNFTQFSDVSVYYKIQWYAEGNMLIRSHVVSALDIDQSVLPLREVIAMRKTAGAQVNLNLLKSFYEVYNGDYDLML